MQIVNLMQIIERTFYRLITYAGLLPDTHFLSSLDHKVQGGKFHFSFPFFFCSFDITVDSLNSVFIFRKIN